jgi:hypothetical protein
MTLAAFTPTPRFALMRFSGRRQPRLVDEFDGDPLPLMNVVHIRSKLRVVRKPDALAVKELVPIVNGYFASIRTGSYYAYGETSIKG